MSRVDKKGKPSESYRLIACFNYSVNETSVFLEQLRTFSFLLKFKLCHCFCARNKVLIFLKRTS